MTSRPTFKTRVRQLPAVIRIPLLNGWSLAKGEWPEALGEVVRPLRTRRPRTYQEKKRYKMARDRRQILVTFSDKLLAREYVSSVIGPEIVIPLLGVAEDAADLPWTELPRQFVCKVNHGSGGVILVSDEADPSAALPRARDKRGWTRHHVHPDSVQPSDIIELANYWLTLPYGWEPGAYREWAYRDINRRVFVEELCHGPTGLPTELKVHCFNGEPRSFLFMDRAPDMKDGARNRYLEAEVDIVVDRLGASPQEWQRLLDDMRALCATTDMLRIDWLITRDGLRFNELTNYPGGATVSPLEGHLTLTPDEVDALYSSYWQVPVQYE